MRNKLYHSSAALILSFVLLFTLCIPAFAADTTEIDFTKNGSISITLKDSSNHKPVSGCSLGLYKVGEIPLNNPSAFILTEEFKASGVDISDLKADGLAEHLLNFAKSRNLSYSEVTTGADGKAVFPNLSLGLYLIFQTNNLEGHSTLKPFLVTVPVSNNGEIIYDVDASPKTDIDPLPDHGDDDDDDDDGDDDDDDNEFIEIKVIKVWAGASDKQPESITVHLLKDGKIVETVVLNKENGWSHIFDNLDPEYQWSVVEDPVPDGYKVQYSKNGNTITITNTKDKPVYGYKELTVKKVWAGDGKTPNPTSVTIDLYNGKVLYDTVVLSADNNWSYKWTDLDENGDWHVVERKLPGSYQVTYSQNGSVITVTNTIKLIQTGQLNWPVPVLAGLGVILLCVGWVLIRRRREQDEA